MATPTSPSEPLRLHVKTPSPAASLPLPPTHFSAPLPLSTIFIHGREGGARAPTAAAIHPMRPAKASTADQHPHAPPAGPSPPTSPFADRMSATAGPSPCTLWPRLPSSGTNRPPVNPPSIPPPFSDRSPAELPPAIRIASASAKSPPSCGQIANRARRGHPLPTPRPPRNPSPPPVCVPTFSPYTPSVTSSGHPPQRPQPPITYHHGGSDGNHHSFHYIGAPPSTAHRVPLMATRAQRRHSHRPPTESHSESPPSVHNPLSPPLSSVRAAIHHRSCSTPSSASLTIPSTASRNAVFASPTSMLRRRTFTMPLSCRYHQSLPLLYSYPLCRLCGCWILDFYHCKVVMCLVYVGNVVEMLVMLCCYVGVERNLLGCYAYVGGVC